MNKFVVVILLIAAGILVYMFMGNTAAVTAQGANLGEWTMDLEAAKLLAKDMDVPLMLKFTGSDWCGWCKIMEKDVFSKSEFLDYAGTHLVLVTIDSPRDKSIVPEEYWQRNQQLFKQYGVRGVPTYVILDANGKEIGRLGAGRGKTPASFIAELKGITG